MKIYVAAPYPYREDAIVVMKALEKKGLTVTSRWLREVDELCDKDARKDLEDIRNADVLLALNPADWENKGSGGRHIEFGYAYALNKHVVLAGSRSNMFHHLNDVPQIDLTIESIVSALYERSLAGPE